MKRSGFRPENVRHEAQLYRAFRPLYPPAIFLPLVKAAPQNVLELGCGTGLALRAAVRAGGGGWHWTGVDPDPEMLQFAEEEAFLLGQQFHAVCTSAESFVSAKHRYDALVVASALHWMNPQVVGPTLRDALCKGATLLWTEYQFPEVVGLDNSWIRESFRERWRFEGQRPRGRFGIL